MSVDNDSTSIGTTTENVAKVHDSIHKERRWTIHYTCSTVALSNGTCQSILSDKLNTRQNATEFVPRLLTDDQKQHRLAVSKEHCSGWAAVFCLQQHDGHPTSLSLTWFSSLWLLPLPQDKKQVKGVNIWHCRGYPGQIVDADTKGLPWWLPIVAAMLGLLCMLSRGLFGRGWRDEDFESAYFVFRYISGTFGQHLIVMWCINEESADSR